MHNNLSAVPKLRLERWAKATGRRWPTAAEPACDGKAIGERPLYRNRIDAIRSNVPYRSSNADGHGVLLHPRPTVSGQQSAIVVGPPGAMIHTDRDHRIKVQFHWQRRR